MHLLDVNVLIALVDQQHAHHVRARTWFLSPERQAWATCPLTENAVVRILGNPTYPAYEGDTNDARGSLNVLISNPGHQFWPDDLSLRDEKTFPNLAGLKHLTDLYLLALTVSHEGRFATLDERIDPGMVTSGAGAYFLLPN